MPDEASDWRAGIKKKNAGQPADVAAQDDTAQTGWRAGIKKKAATDKPAPGIVIDKGQQQPEFGLTKSVLQPLMGGSFADKYQGSGLQKSLESILPESAKGDKTYVGRVLARMYTAAPESIDFITSPAGIGLMALHAVPQARGAAALADLGLTVYGGAQTLKAASAFYDDPSAENMADLGVAMAQTWLSRKAMTGADAAHAPVKTADLVANVDREVRGKLSRTITKEKAKLAGEAPDPLTGKPLSPADKLAKKVAVLDSSASKTPTVTRAAKEYVSSGGPASKDIGAKRVWESVVAKTANTPILGDVTRAFMSPRMPELMEISKDIVQDRAINESIAKHKFNTVMHAFEETVPPEELKIYDVDPNGKIVPSDKIAAAIQGTGGVKLAGLSKHGQALVSRIRSINQENATLLKKFGNEGLIDPDQYLTQIWDFGTDGNSPNAKAGKAIMRDRFLNKRVIDDYETGIKLGLKPKYNNVIDVMKVRQNYLIRAMENQRAASVFSDMGGIASEDQVKKLGLHDWIKLDDVAALSKAVYRGSEQGGSKQFFSYQPVWAHPQMAPALRGMFGKAAIPDMRTLESIRSIGKHLNLMGSLFHQWAITEQSQALTAGNQGVVPGLKQWWFTNPEIYKGAQRGLVEVIGKGSKTDLPIFRLDQGMVDGALRSGVHLDTAIIDAESGTRNHLRNFGKDEVGWKNAVTAPIRALGHANHILERSLWDYYMPSQMINSFEMVKNSYLDRLGSSASPERVAAVERQVAEQINNAYGAIKWEEMLVSPTTSRLLNWVFLAPGWKVSNFRVFTDGLKGGLGADMALNYARGAAITWFISAQVGNFLSTALLGNKDKDGKTGGHFTWKNAGLPFKINGWDTGLTNNSFGLVAGYKPNGSERVINWGKGFLEPFHAASDPFAWFMGSTSAPVRAVGSAIYGVDPVTGYEFVDREDSKTKQWMERVDQVLPLFLPFVARDPLRAITDPKFRQIYPLPGGYDTLFNLAGLPTRQGVNYDLAKKMYISAKEDGDEQAATQVLAYMRASKLNPIVAMREYQKRQGTKRKKDQPMKTVYSITGEPMNGQ